MIFFGRFSSMYVVDLKKWNTSGFGHRQSQYIIHTPLVSILSLGWPDSQIAIFFRSVKVELSPSKVYQIVGASLPTCSVRLDPFALTRAPPGGNVTGIAVGHFLSLASSVAPVIVLRSSDSV